MKRVFLLFLTAFFISLCIMFSVGATDKKADTIKYVEFNVTKEALQTAIENDINTKNEDIHLDCIQQLAYLGAKYGGDFSKYKQKDLNQFCNKLKNGESLADITKDMKHYSYYEQPYTAVLNGMIKEFEEKDSNGEIKTTYGISWFSPIANTFPFSHYDDFGAQRTYGYSRPHLGHDLMAAVGTPVIAVESGIVEALGWNQYGGWRIGIRSDDSKRYWYYAHLRQNRPYAAGLKQGDRVEAGDVIGYVGRTGYSTTENVNGITESHLHIGLELIFDEKRREKGYEIWVDMYALTEVLQNHKSTTIRNNETKEFTKLQ